MKYDTVKDKFAKLIDVIPLFRKFFYLLLDMLLLRQWYVKREIKRHFSKSKPVNYHDAGAGFCQYSYFILKNWKKSQVHTSDIKTDYINSFEYYAKNNGMQNVSCKQADLTNYVPDGKFDLITAIDIMEHIEDDVQVLKNFRTTLKSGGKLIISSPSNFDESAAFTEEHVRPGYSKEDIVSKLESTGFKIVSFEYSYGKFGKMYWNLALKIPLSLIEKSKLFLFVLPLYYLFFYQISFVFMMLDLKTNNKIGTGILVVAE